MYLWHVFILHVHVLVHRLCDIYMQSCMCIYICRVVAYAAGTCVYPLEGILPVLRVHPVLPRQASARQGESIQSSLGKPQLGKVSPSSPP